MFKAKYKNTDEEIIIIEECWNENNVSVLKEYSHDEKLICPFCSYPLIVKAGDIKQWHFAHAKGSSQVCPLKSENFMRLIARKMLYNFLVKKEDYFSDVILEENIEGEEINIVVDCAVKYKDKKIAYIVLQNNTRKREELGSVKSFMKR